MTDLSVRAYVFDIVIPVYNEERDSTVGKVVELSVLVVANLVPTLVRFVALRWVFSA
jgi:hypothetical protein